MALLNLLRAALIDRKGVSSLEYGLLAVGILTGLAVAVAALEGPIKTLYGTTIPALL